MYLPKKYNVIEINILNNLQILVISDKKSLKKFLSKNSWMENNVHHCLDDNGGSYVLFNEENVPHFVLYINNVSKRVIIHECTHLVHQIMESKGIPISIDNSEIMAYMTDYLSTQVMNLLIKS